MHTASNTLTPAQLPSGHHLVAPVICRPAYVVGFESWNRHTFVHFDLRQPSAEDLAALVADLQTANTLHGLPLYAIARPDQPILIGFLTNLGFRLSGQAQDTEGRPALVYGRSHDGSPTEHWLPSSVSLSEGN